MRFNLVAKCGSLLLCNLITRNSSGDEIANVNFLYDDIVHALENTIDSCINSATDRRFTKFSEITQCNGHYAVQDYSRSPILVPIEGSYTTLLVININLPPILHRFQVMADYWSNFRCGVSHFNTLAGNIAINDMSLKTRFCGLHFHWCIFNHFYVIRPESYRIR